MSGIIMGDFFGDEPYFEAEEREYNETRFLNAENADDDGWNYDE